MTKKEQARVDQLENDLRLAKALSWTQPVAPDVAPPIYSEVGNRLTTGFLFNHHSNRVAPACSSSIHHNFGGTERTTTQGAVALYSTKLRALQALRHEVEKDCAARLAAIDKQIEQELAAE